MKKRFVYVMFVLCIAIVGSMQGTPVHAQWVESKPSTGCVSSITSLGNMMFCNFPCYRMGGQYAAALWRSTDSGLTWLPSDTGMYDLTTWSVFAMDSVLLVGTDENGVYRSTDTGRSWEHVASDTVGSVYAFVRIGEVICAFDNNGIWRSVDNGITWNWIYRQSNFIKWPGIMAASAVEHQGIAYFIGHFGAYRSTDGGQSWTTFSGGENDINPIAVKDSFIFTASNTVWRSSDAGNSWQEVHNGLPPKDSTAPIGAILAADNALFLCIGEEFYNDAYEGHIFCSTNSGDSWRDVSQGLRYGDMQCLYRFADYLFAGAMPGGGGVSRRPLSQMIGSSGVAENTAPPPSEISLSLARGTLWVSSPCSMSRVVVYDVLGRAVAKSDVRESRTASMDVGALPAGVYFVRVTQASGDVRTMKLAKE